MVSQKSVNNEPSSINEAFSQVEPSSNYKSPPVSLQHKPYNPNSGDLLNPDYTFSTFVVGRNTEFAHAASFNVAQNPGAEGYNPLFICGPVGMGKTHLIHAVGNQIKISFPNLKITYVSAESYLNECVA